MLPASRPIRPSNALGVVALTVLTTACGSGGGGGSGGETSTVSTIGFFGGQVEADGVVLTIPPRALAEDTDIELTVGAKTSLPGGATLLSRVVTLEPSGLAFAVPGTLSLPLSGSGPMGVLWTTEAGTNLVPAEREEDRAVARVTHFSDAAATEIAPSSCGWNPVRRDFGESCETQVIDDPLVCAVVTWGDLERPKTTLSFANKDPGIGHIRLDRVLVDGSNVLAQDAGERDTGLVSPNASFGWVWEVGEGIDDSLLPPEWQEHERTPYPNEFGVWRSDEDTEMSYCATAEWTLLSPAGVSERSTTCCYQEMGSGTGDEWMRGTADGAPYESADTNTARNVSTDPPFLVISSTIADGRSLGLTVPTVDFIGTCSQPGGDHLCHGFYADDDGYFATSPDAGEATITITVNDGSWIEGTLSMVGHLDAEPNAASKSADAEFRVRAPTN